MERKELSLEQEHALQLFENGENIFITGPAGTGKTCLINQIVASAIRRRKNYQICAMTGCAALLLGCNVSTLHSWSGIRLAKGTIEEVCANVEGNKKNTAKWKKIQVLVVDEVSMMSLRLFNILNYIGKRIRNIDSRPFGGIQLVFTGDFYQLPPVGGAEDGSSSFCFQSENWYNTFSLDNHIVLSTIFRQKDPQYKNILNNIRVGQIDQSMIDLLNSYINRPYNKDDHNGCVPTKLFAIRKKVEMINQQMFDAIEEPCYEYNHIVKKDCSTWVESGKLLTYETMAKCRKELNPRKMETELEFLLSNCPCERILHLKKGANVMCTVNLDLEAGICNGSIGIIVEFIVVPDSPPIPVVLFSNGIKRQMMLKYWQCEEFPTLAIAQIPLRLAWAMTIHKIQGATLPMAEIDIGNSIFEYGQTYVALSRVKNLDGLYLCGFQPSKIKIHPKVKDFYESIPIVEYEEEEEEDKIVGNKRSVEKDQELELENMICDNKKENTFINMGAKWTKDEEDKLLEYLAQDFTIKTIAQLHQRTPGSITARRKLMAYHMHLENKSMLEIIDKTKLSEKQILDTIQKNQMENSNIKNVPVSFEQFAYQNDMDIPSNNIKVLKLD